MFLIHLNWSCFIRDIGFNKVKFIRKIDNVLLSFPECVGIVRACFFFKYFFWLFDFLLLFLISRACCIFCIEFLLLNIYVFLFSFNFIDNLNWNIFELVYLLFFSSVNKSKAYLFFSYCNFDSSSINIEAINER